MYNILLLLLSDFHGVAFQHRYWHVIYLNLKPNVSFDIN